MAQGTWGGTGGTRIFRVNVRWQIAQQKCQTGFHIRDVGAGTLDPSDVTDAVVPWAQVQFIKCLHSSAQLLEVDTSNLVTKEGAAHSFSALNGSGGGAAPPSFITVPISLKGTIRTRYGNGRMLWPVNSAAAYDANQLSSTYVTGIQPVIDDLASRFINGGGLFDSMALVHAHEALPAHGTRGAIPASWYDITSIRMNTLISSLRRRKVGVGS